MRASAVVVAFGLCFALASAHLCLVNPIQVPEYDFYILDLQEPRKTIRCICSRGFFFPLKRFLFVTGDLMATAWLCRLEQGCIERLLARVPRTVRWPPRWRACWIPHGRQRHHCVYEGRFILCR